MTKEQQAFIRGFQLGLKDAAVAVEMLPAVPESWTVSGTEGQRLSFNDCLDSIKHELQTAFLWKANDAAGAAMVWEATQGGNE